MPKVMIEKLKVKKQKLGFFRYLMRAYIYDMKRYFSNSYSQNALTEQKLIGKIIRDYHVIEKGLTMPETRLGFGKDLVLSLIKDCLLFAERYGENEVQLDCAVGVLYEYEKFHRDSNYELENSIQEALKDLRKVFKNKPLMPQKETTRAEYFNNNESNFPIFAKSRNSVRHYSDMDLPMSQLTQALELARTTPSACNRQCWRTYVFEDTDLIKEILAIQGGNRGFGHLTNKLIVVASETGVFAGVNERNEAFIDGGMYTMNLLYSLHYFKIAACVLNCSNSIDRDLKLRELCGIKDSEVFICMISCGIPPEKFKIASSHRYGIERTNKII